MSAENLLPAPVPHPRAPKWKAMPAEVTAERMLAARNRIGDDIKGTFLDVKWEGDFAPLLPHVDTSKIRRIIAAQELTFSEYDWPPTAPERYKQWSQYGTSCEGQAWFVLYEDTDGLFHHVEVLFNECCLTDPLHELVSNASSRDFATLWNDLMTEDDRYHAYTTLYEVQEWLEELEAL